MFYKLAARNVRRSFRDYGVYLLTLTFGVCLFYTFNSIDGQGAMVYLAKSNNPVVGAILMMIDIFSVFVTVVLACLILYANRFLLRRRKRELGTYLLLGLSQGQVSWLLFLETGIVGLVSLAAGLGLGLLASQGMSALTLSMFSIQVEAFSLVFSWKAVGKTVLYFGLIFLLVMVFSGAEVSRARLIDLLQGQRRNETLKQRSLAAAVVQLVLGVLCLLAAYAILMLFGMAVAVAVLPICIPMLTLGTVGTLLIFKSLSGFVLKFAQGHPRFYYNNLNLFTLRQWISRVHTTYLSQTVICILLLLAIGITASSVGLNSTIENMTDNESPVDITLRNNVGMYDTEEEGLLDFDALLQAAGFDVESRLSGRALVSAYYNDPDVTGDWQAGTVLTQSDYNTLMAFLGREAVTLAPGESRLVEPERALVNGSLANTLLVVEDGVAEQLDTGCQLWAANYSGEPQAAEQELLAVVRPLQENRSIWVDSRLIAYEDLMGSKIMVLFLGMYLGFTFLLAAAAVLALQQLSQAADNTGRYAILRRLGAEEKLVARSATHQVALAFLLPLGLALIHSMVGMKAANDIIAQVGRVDSVHSSMVTAFVLVLVYGGYFLATALACRRMTRNP
ncbi:MAG: FtsX-like permease family protein [Lawsonibacter sp.]|nr:FtsX-like permease family protein [Lawsonibacter sp.]